MKIVITGDLHLNKSVYKGIMDKDQPILPFRNVDFMKAFSYVCDKTVENSPDLMIINGDSYDNHNPSNEIRGFFSSQIYKISSNKIPIIMLIGNHDICRKNHGLLDIQKLHLDNITVVSSPTVMKFKDKNLILFPYTMDVEQKNITIKDEFYKFIKEVHDKKQEKNSLFFGHFGVSGGKINEFEEVSSDEDDGEVEIIKKSFFNKKKDDISVADLDLIGSDYVFLGDYHRFQILPTKKCLSFYSGSLEKTDMSEKDSEKGFILYDSDSTTDPKFGKCRFIEYPNTRPMIEFKGNLQEIRKAIENINPEKLKNSVVKLSFSGDKSELNDFNIKLDELKSQISKTIDPIHIYHTQKVTDKEQELKALKIEKEMLEKGNLEASDVESVVTEMIKEREQDPEEQKQILLLDKKIRDEVKEEKMGMI
jgi:DNA repair exonuclease SbcCD nuclease subunit